MTTSPWFVAKQVKTAAVGAPPTAADAGPDLVLVAATPLSALRVVTYVTPQTVTYLDPALPIAVCCLAGITKSAAPAAGLQVTVCRSGWLTDQLWNWTPGAPVYCSAGGVLTQTWSHGWAHCVTVGHAINQKTLLVRIREPITQV